MEVRTGSDPCFSCLCYCLAGFDSLTCLHKESAVVNVGIQRCNTAAVVYDYTVAVTAAGTA